MIRHKCPACGEKLKTPDSLAGGVEMCPTCRREVTVPQGPPPDVTVDYGGVGLPLCVSALIVIGLIALLASSAGLDGAGRWSRSTAEVIVESAEYLGGIIFGCTMIVTGVIIAVAGGRR